MARRAFQTFIRLVLPLSVPALGAFAIFQFLWVWNDLLVALVFLGPGKDVQVMPTALSNMIGPRGGAWHLLTAGAFLTMIVPLVVFLALQRFFVRGILAGSVKYSGGDQAYPRRSASRTSARCP